MSKIIKSAALVKAEMILLEPDHFLESFGKITSNEENQFELDNNPQEQDDDLHRENDLEVEDEIAEDLVDPVADAIAQAQEIINETEEKVKELLELARQQSAAILEEAREQAKSIISDAQQEAVSLKNQQSQLGYQQGYQKAIADAQKEANGIIEEAAIEAEAARQAKKAYIDTKEKEMIELALVIAERILQYEINGRSDAVLKIAVNALSKVRDASQVILKVNPRDFVFLQSIRSELMGMVRGLRTLSIEEDEAVSPGGCVVDTGQGYIDARIDSQMEEVRRVIRQVMNISGH